MAVVGVKVEGLRELNRALGRVEVGLKTELRTALKEAGEPVRALAERRSSTEISNMRAGSIWSRVRLGVSGTTAYIVPRARRNRGGSPRPNLAILLLDRAYEPALMDQEDEIESKVEVFVHELTLKAGL